jgi:hypothetical protein
MNDKLMKDGLQAAMIGKQVGWPDLSARLFIAWAGRCVLGRTAIFYTQSGKKKSFDVAPGFGEWRDRTHKR